MIMTERQKIHETIGCCGIDCGLCPRFHTNGNSACPGCGGLNFREKHPSCGFLTCCASKKSHEVCSFCEEYPCKRFDAEKEGYDSFVTHRKVFENLEFIKSNGIEQFTENQKMRISILNDLFNKYDDGRSKSFYCLACALLPAENLLEIRRYILNLPVGIEPRESSRLIKDVMTKMADPMNIELKLRNKKYR